MIESVMEEEDQEIKDQQQGGGGGATQDLSGTSAVEQEGDGGGVKKKLKESEFELSKLSKKEKVGGVDKVLMKGNVVEEESEAPQNCVIDVKCCSSNNVGNNNNKLEGGGGGGGGGENCDVEKVCRICHLSVDSPSSTDNNNNLVVVADMIQLGCGCKDELGIAHRHCAERWFKLKGNRCCEICGEAAKNITGMWDDRFMEDWNDRRSVGSNSLDRRWGFWRGQPFCNFLMACLVMAFVLPWFFRVNMF